VAAVPDVAADLPVAEVAPGIHRLALPLGIHGVATVSAYLFAGSGSGNGGGDTLVDCGVAAAPTPDGDPGPDGTAALGLFDPNAEASESLARRLREHFPELEVTTGSKDPEGYDVVVNATPLGMNDDDPLPMDVDRIAPGTFVGEVVMKQEITPFLAAAQERGCPIQVGSDMLYEMIPAYLEFFGFGTATPEELRAVSQIG